MKKLLFIFLLVFICNLQAQNRTELVRIDKRKVERYCEDSTQNKEVYKVIKTKSDHKYIIDSNYDIVFLKPNGKEVGEIRVEFIQFLNNHFDFDWYLKHVEYYYGETVPFLPMVFKVDKQGKGRVWGLLAQSSKKAFEKEVLRCVNGSNFDIEFPIYQIDGTAVNYFVTIIVSKKDIKKEKLINH